MRFKKFKLFLPLAIRKSITLIDGTLNNNGFYFINNYDSNILFHNPNLNIYKALFTNETYSSICFDSKENCFWALEKISNKLYKLNLDMNEISFINTLIYPHHAKIKNLCYNQDNDSLILTSLNKIEELNKNGDVIKIIHDLKGNYFYLSSYYFCNTIFSLWCYKNSYYLSLYDENNHMKCYKLPSNFRFMSIICIDHEKSSSSFLIYLLVKCRKKHNHLMSISLNNIRNTTCNTNMYSYSKHMNKLSSEGYKASILEAISLQEIGLSNILSMEGSKMQKAISLAENTNDLLKINKCADKLLTSITVLENILLSKIKSILDKD